MYTLEQTVSGPDESKADVVLVSKKAVEISPGPPDPTMFEISDWPERKPSEVLQLYSTKFRLPFDPKAPSATLADQAYNVNRP
ncbi:MAG: hypothetical protein M3Y72_10715 [Acidobacteriota bacterium]|nr:hypothetical protein [Acidobacteriota bacterium]